MSHNQEMKKELEWEKKKTLRDPERDKRKQTNVYNNCNCRF